MASSSSLEALKKALDFENNGRSYYQQAREKAGHPTTKAMFEFLIEEEEKHVQYLKTLHEKLKATDKWPSEVTVDLDLDFIDLFKQESKNIDSNVKVSSNELEALSHAMEMEERGRDMYKDLSEKAGDANEKELFASLAKWEQGHIDYIRNYHDYFMDHGMHTDE